MSRSFYCYVHIVEIYRNFAICVANIYLSLSFILNLIHSTCVWRMNLKFYKVRLINTAAAMSSPGAAVVKNLPCQRRRHERDRFCPWVRKISWGRKRQCTPVFLPGKSHGQRSLVGYSQWGHKELDTTEQLSTHTKHLIQLY